jgi:hypothetical protein
MTFDREGRETAPDVLVSNAELLPQGDNGGIEGL